MAITFASKDQEPAPLSYAFAARVIERAKGPRVRVLDVACNTGETTAVLGRALPSAEVCGIDLDPACIEQCKAHALPNVQYLLKNALRTGFADGHFDAIVTGHTIEHFDEPHQKDFLREVKRILKHDGLLIASTPDVYVLRLQGAAGLQPDHVRELTRGELEELLEHAGFSVQAWWGQGIVDRNDSHMVRRICNALKKFDVFRLRRFLSRRAVNAIDEKTHPFKLDFEVKPLPEGKRAYNMIAICGKA